MPKLIDVNDKGMSAIIKRIGARIAIGSDKTIIPADNRICQQAEATIMKMQRTFNL